MKQNKTKMLCSHFNTCQLVWPVFWKILLAGHTNFNLTAHYSFWRWHLSGHCLIKNKLYIVQNQSIIFNLMIARSLVDWTTPKNLFKISCCWVGQNHCSLFDCLIRFWFVHITAFPRASVVGCVNAEIGNFLSPCRNITVWMNLKGSIRWPQTTAAELVKS